MTLQCVFKGKAQEAYSALPLEDAADYEEVKQAVLHIYSLVPEAYRQKFRSYQKPEALSYAEFIREKEMLFLVKFAGSDNLPGPSGFNYSGGF